MMFGWVLIVILIYYIYSHKGGAIPRVNSKSAKEVLDDRLVRGEIDEETYVRMKKILEDR